MKRSTITRGAALASLLGIGAIYLLNASWLARPPMGKPTLISHRGVYQTYSRDNLERDDCTAVRIYPPEHDYLENTTVSIEAAFSHGADIVEIDIHPTTDGEFAVFHDWTLECRTNGEGVTREHTMEALSKLDIGYGYTFDGGKTFPFRAQGVGLMPTLEKILRSFPNRQFLINIKSNDSSEAEKLDRYLRERQLVKNTRLMVYGGANPIARLRTLRPGALAFSRESVKRCALNYLLIGWSGYVPEDCRNSLVIAPNTWHWALWGWPNRYIDRVTQAGSMMMVVDHRSGKQGMPGIYLPKELAYLPGDYSGAVWIEKIEVIGPYLKAHQD
ncbi:glycerophosphodiester phosphodiesterase [Microbulbifer sp. OS29]|uniref:Glycerophosphodiester phosphodiesterase n=1 Tax=Microbulbifer okhotskensis TaxID=2926617 RepID=A0A9X2J620_9GAMM|nr:glycerophosphodiester phosphodiesterase family protein [Microbulbifer okhotskensis]MCO1333001.1 glycerophosphodiester phosphodiesterase [Microbulbifer okhotskensis]